ncbi:hypothetical protein DP117_13880 [Brasilonema sp. UFV-L1]|nr:hypothetical protein [Brasilonema sp. UFV-L1]
MKLDTEDFSPPFLFQVFGNKKEKSATILIKRTGRGDDLCRISITGLRGQKRSQLFNWFALWKALGRDASVEGK